jgi:hypothetical protein
VTIICLGSVDALSRVFGLDRIVLAEPLFNLFPLRGQHDTLPFHQASTLIILSHYVRTLIEDLDEALTL